MSRKRISTSLEGWKGPFFPDHAIEELNTLFDKTRIGAELLEKASLTIQRSIKKDVNVVTTSDRYEWFIALYFKAGTGEVVILFPWKNDTEKEDGTSLDRSIAIYAKGQALNIEITEITQIIEAIQLRLLKEREKQLTAEIEQVASTITRIANENLVSFSEN